jgi:hypothetical protein
LHASEDEYASSIISGDALEIHLRERHVLVEIVSKMFDHALFLAEMHLAIAKGWLIVGVAR